MLHANRLRGSMAGRTVAILLILACLGGICAATHARAQEATFCVTCTKPDRSYRCRITGVDPAFADALKLYCVIRLSKDGHHATCSASASTHCDGPLKVYAYGGPSIGGNLASNPELRKLQKKIEHDNQQFAQPDNTQSGAPKTLFGLTSRVFSASKRGINNATSKLTGSGEPAAPAVNATATETSPAPPAPTPAPAPPPSAATKPAAESAGTGEPQPAASSESESFIHRSYRCLRSFFRHCGSSNEAAAE
jgi:hypothetical protein